MEGNSEEITYKSSSYLDIEPVRRGFLFALFDFCVIVESVVLYSRSVQEKGKSCFLNITEVLGQFFSIENEKDGFAQ